LENKVKMISSRETDQKRNQSRAFLRGSDTSGGEAGQEQGREQGGDQRKLKAKRPRAREKRQGGGWQESGGIPYPGLTCPNRQPKKGGYAVGKKIVRSPERGGSKKDPPAL